MRLNDILHIFDVTGASALPSKPGNQFIPPPPSPALSLSKSTFPQLKAGGAAFEKWILIKITPQTDLWCFQCLQSHLPLFFFFFFNIILQSGERLPFAKLECWRQPWATPVGFAGIGTEPRKALLPLGKRGDSALLQDSLCSLHLRKFVLGCL